MPATVSFCKVENISHTTVCERREGRFLRGKSGNLPNVFITVFLGVRCAALAVSCVINVSLAQVRLQGKVVDESNEPIPGANIRVSESLNGTTTDAGGKFELNLPDGNHRIRVTYLGYEQGVYQTDHSEKDVVIKLKEKYVNIDQVVVTGTGSHRRMSNSPIPVKVLTGKDLKEASVTNFQDAMTKLNPSIVFMENGQGATMNMNGLTEKYVVILENGKRLAGDDTYSRIDMSNVKRVEILNGAASALYGSDAIAGVINIITDDSRNKVNVTSNSRYGSKNQFLQSVNADVNVGKFGSYTSYQYQRADGWQLNPYTESKGELVPTNKQASGISPERDQPTFHIRRYGSFVFLCAWHFLRTFQRSSDADG